MGIYNWLLVRCDGRSTGSTGSTGSSSGVGCRLHVCGCWLLQRFCFDGGPCMFFQCLSRVSIM